MSWPASSGGRGSGCGRGASQYEREADGGLPATVAATALLPHAVDPETEELPRVISLEALPGEDAALLAVARRVEAMIATPGGGATALRSYAGRLTELGSGPDNACAHRPAARPRMRLGYRVLVGIENELDWLASIGLVLGGSRSSSRSGRGRRRARPPGTRVGGARTLPTTSSHLLPRHHPGGASVDLRSEFENPCPAHREKVTGSGLLGRKSREPKSSRLVSRWLSPRVRET